MAKVSKIALTGGPCAGKTSVIEALKYEFGEDVVIVPEVATQLIVPLDEGGVGIPGVDVEWSQEWQDNLQRKITEKQIEDETYQIQLADLRERPTVVICDRGVLDGAAYVEGGRDEFLRTFNLDLEKCYALYDQIIHLSSLACDDPEKYLELLKTNPSRTEPPEKAAELDQKLFAIYEGHPNHKRVSSKKGIEAKIELVLSEIRQELERLKRELDVEIASEGKPRTI